MTLGSVNKQSTTGTPCWGGKTGTYSQSIIPSNFMIFDLQVCMPKMASSTRFFCTDHVNTLSEEGINSSIGIFLVNPITFSMNGSLHWSNTLFRVAECSFSREGRYAKVSTRLSQTRAREITTAEAINSTSNATPYLLSQLSNPSWIEGTWIHGWLIISSKFDYIGFYHVPI